MGSGLENKPQRDANLWEYQVVHGWLIAVMLQMKRDR
jgi:hypothetical protein